MSFVSAQIDNCEITLCRTGYTGELGFEIICKWDEAAQAKVKAGQLELVK